jgi:hypothetical protein
MTRTITLHPPIQLDGPSYTVTNKLFETGPLHVFIGGKLFAILEPGISCQIPQADLNKDRTNVSGRSN